jgi:hypothetical protein
MKTDFLTYIIVGFVLIVCLKVYTESELYSLKCVISSVDGKKYCVRDREKINEAADLLAKVTEKCKDLVVYLDKHYPDNDDVKRLVKGFNPKRIS